MSDPSIGRIVHYVSYGTPGGEYPSACRAAIVTACYPDELIVDLAVVNPEGFFFNKGVPYFDEKWHQGGTWHWPERTEE